MGRLKKPLIRLVFCLAAIAALGACTLPQSSANSQVNMQIPQFVAPQNLIGATAGLLAAEFGQPSLLRVDGTAQVWLYHSASCGMNLFLYPDAAGVPRVTLATAADGSPAVGDCPASLQQSHRDGGPNMPAAASLPGPSTAALEPPAAS